MRYAVISDVHANLEALSSVLLRLKKESFDSLFFLGDSVGYGPDPNECVEILKESSGIMLAGNHDRASIGLLDTEYFNIYARIAVDWTRETLTPGNRDLLGELPVAEKTNGLFLVHSTPKEPEQWNYLLTKHDAEINFRSFAENICLIGHSHQPGIIELTPDNMIKIHQERLRIRPGHRYIVNAGSVGQPRDGNPEAAYVLFDNNSVEIKRCPYDIVSTQQKMRNAGLPARLIDRLERGL